MRRLLMVALLVAGAMACAWPCVTWGAAAVKLGKSGYSGTLSSDPLTRSQQLLCDPIGADPLLYGSTSTTYDAATVALVSVFGLNGYGVDAYVQAVLRPSIDVIAPPAAGGPLLVPIDQFFTNRGSYIETGLVRVLFNSDGGQPGFDDPNVDLRGRTYDRLGHVGPEGTITHGLTFDYRDGADPLTFVTYTNFAGPDDFLQFGGDGGRVTDIAPASITANVSSVAAPLPTAAWAGLTLMGALAGARAFRTHRGAAKAA